MQTQSAVISDAVRTCFTGRFRCGPISSDSRLSAVSLVATSKMTSVFAFAFIISAAASDGLLSDVLAATKEGADFPLIS